MLKPQYPIRTERLLIRPFLDRDLGDLFDLYRRPDVTRYLYWEPFSPSDARRSLDKRLDESLVEERKRLVLAVVLPEVDRMVGDIALRCRGHPEGEIGYSLHPDYQRHGFATEAAEVVVQLGFDGLGLHRIVGRCDARNAASARVLERLGMRQEAYFVHHELVKGEWRDELVYAICEDEWRARKASPTGRARIQSQAGTGTAGLSVAVRPDR